MLRKNGLSLLLVVFALFATGILNSPLAQAAATFTVINNDGASEGFNDPTPAAPVGGNSGTTIGQQRLIAFQYAANIWGAKLTSSVAIRVRAQFDILTCSATSAVLGSAGPVTVHSNFPNAPVANTWYAAALANALSGSDLDPASDDISATFNSSIGTTCAFPNGWYYGLDGNPPGSQIDFVSVLIHELGHGLGFLSLVDLGSGAKFMGSNDTYMRFLENHGASPADYPSMSNAQRVAASTSTGNLHWTGANVRAASGVLSAGTVGDHVRMYAPNPAQSGSSVSHWDTVLTPNQVMEPSYTQALHDPVLEMPLFQDIGWSIVTQTFALTVSKTGSGTVTSSPAGINCGATCSANFSAGAQVTLTPTPTAGWVFTGWGGACSGTGSCIVTMNSAQSVSATFTQTFALTVSKTGTGTVTSSPAGINCGATCSASYNSGTQVTLTPTPAAGWSFTSWGGACSGAGSCIVTMDAAKSVSATFTQQSFALTVSKSGSGTVTSSPAGINCGATCSANYLSGTQVTLTATAAGGWTFTGWGGACSGTGSCIVTMNSAQSVSATFSQQIFTLSVSKVGSGTVTSSPAGINCGATCSANFGSGTSVTLTATPGSGSSFANWTENGSVVSTNAAYTFTIAGSRALVANFAGLAAYVSPRNGTDSGACPITAPCATLNYALSVTNTGGAVTILNGGTFGPVVLTKAITINGPGGDIAQIVANPAAQVGCVGALPASCALTNHGYAVEITAGVNDSVVLDGLTLAAGSNGTGAAKVNSGGVITLTDNVFRGNTASGSPAVSISANSAGNSVDVFLTGGEIAFHPNGVGVEVRPAGNTQARVQIARTEIHHTLYGIRIDGSSQASGATTNVMVANSHLFSFSVAGTIAFSSGGTGTVNPTFRLVEFGNVTGPAILANGPLTNVVLTGSTISGNSLGVQLANSAKVFTSIDNTIKRNNTDVSGTLTASPRR